MKICAFSDMHGNLDFKVEQCDLVLICGDIVPLYMQDNLQMSEIWFERVFVPWCNKLPCEKVLFIGGNHDWFLFYSPEIMKKIIKENDKIEYLDCEIYEYNGKVIYGTPMCKIFGNWAFMYPNNEQSKKYKNHLKAIDKIDIIISHDAPYGTSDVLLQEDCPWANGEHIGNYALKDFVRKAKPNILFHGHLHSTNHEKEMLDDTEVYNVSLLDEAYRMKYEPLYIEF